MPQFTDKVEPKDFAKMPKEYQDLLVRLLARRDHALANGGAEDRQQADGKEEPEGG